MKRRLMVIVVMVIVFTLVASSVFAQFGTSIHATRNGKTYWYGADTNATGAPQPGFETLTNVPIADLGCLECHPGDNLDANGDAYAIPFPGASCVDCHATATPTPPSPGAVTEADCYGCHGRQKTEKDKLGYGDVHRDASTPLVCWDCHTTTDMHGDGTEYSSMLEPGATVADCSNSGCHDTLDPAHAANDPHGGKVHCSSCHAKTVISCYNCHFESQVDHHVKRAKQPLHDFVILANRDKDNKVYPMSFQSITYQGNSWVAFGPFSPHTITKDDARVCTDCHVNMGGDVDAINQYNNNGFIQFATWNDTDNTLAWTHGVIPMPADYQEKFKMDFLTFDGDPSSPAGTDNDNWSKIGTDWTGHQMMFASPLTKEQMDALGFDTSNTSVDYDDAGLPDGFSLEQNYPNPFNPTTDIRYSVPVKGHVKLMIYSITGQLLETVVDMTQPQGEYTYTFDARDLPSGVYFYRLETPDYQNTKRMVLMR